MDSPCNMVGDLPCQCQPLFSPSLVKHGLALRLPAFFLRSASSRSSSFPSVKSALRFLTTFFSTSWRRNDVPVLPARVPSYRMGGTP